MNQQFFRCEILGQDLCPGLYALVDSACMIEFFAKAVRIINYRCDSLRRSAEKALDQAVRIEFHLQQRILQPAASARYRLAVLIVVGQQVNILLAGDEMVPHLRRAVVQFIGKVGHADQAARDVARLHIHLRSLREDSRYAVVKPSGNRAMLAAAPFRQVAHHSFVLG